jgi:hypothetical protein
MAKQSDDGKKADHGQKTDPKRGQVVAGAENLEKRPKSYDGDDAA